MTAILKPPVSLFLLILLTICTVPLAASGVYPCGGDNAKMTPGEICYTAYSADGTSIAQQLVIDVTACVWISKQQGQTFQPACLTPDSVTLHAAPIPPAEIGKFLTDVTAAWSSGCKLLTENNAASYYILAKSIKHPDSKYKFTCVLKSAKKNQ